MMMRFKVVGVGTTCRMQDLNGIRTLFCPRDTGASGINLDARHCNPCQIPPIQAAILMVPFSLLFEFNKETPK